MIYNPHPYQSYATERIINESRLGLFLDLGLGKTVVSLTAIAELLNRSMIKKVLVIAPLRVAQSVWSTEAQKWEHTKHLRISKVLGNPKQRAAALEADADVYVANRDIVEKIVRHCADDWRFDMVVVDEFSSFKDPHTKRFKALKSVLPQIKRLIGLTATPASNGYEGLWSQLYLLDEGERLGQYISHYRERYFIPRLNHKTSIPYMWKLMDGADKIIFNKISDICVSMSAQDYLTLPPRIDRIVPVELPLKARSQYDELEDELILSLGDSDVVAGSAAILCNKLLQISNGAVYDENKNVKHIHDEKLAALSDLIESANGNPVLVFYSYRHDADRILAYLSDAGFKKDIGVLKTDADIEMWNAGKVQIMLAHPASCGYGLNLQAGGNTIIWFGLPWSLEQYEQAIGRIHRQGQTKPVTVFHLVAQNTLDEVVLEALGSKRNKQSALLDAVKARIGLLERAG